MANNLQIEKLLEPIASQYKKNIVISTAVNTANNCILILLFWLIFQVLLKLLFNADSFFNVANLLVLAGISIYFLSMVLIALIDKINDRVVACVVDNITNPHDIVASGLEYQTAGRNSDFAIFSIAKASKVLADFDINKLINDKSQLKYKTAGMVLLLAVFSFLIPEDVKLLENNNIIASNPNSVNSQIEFDKESVLRQTKKADNNQSARESSFFITANASSKMSSGDSNYITIGSQKDTAAFTVNQSPARKMVSGNKVNEYQEDSFQMNSNNTASASLSNLSESNVKTGDLFAGSVDQDNQLESESNDRKETGNNNSSGKSPMLDDNASAPSRELGRAGKKKGQAGNGRGGLGSVKKSRATASIVAGKPVPVFIKSRQNKGRSKSIILNSPVGRDVERNMALSDSLEHESPIDKLVIGKEMETLVTNYFKEITEYANRKHESSTRQDN